MPPLPLWQSEMSPAVATCAVQKVGDHPSLETLLWGFGPRLYLQFHTASGLLMTCQMELELVYHILKWPHQVQLANICNLLPRLCGGQILESCKSMDSGPVLGQLSTDSVMWLRRDFCLLLLKTKSTDALHWLCLLMSTSAKDSKNNLGLMKRVLKWALYSH